MNSFINPASISVLVYLTQLLFKLNACYFIFKGSFCTGTEMSQDLIDGTQLLQDLNAGT